MSVPKGTEGLYLLIMYVLHPPLGGPTLGISYGSVQISWISWIFQDVPGISKFIEI